MLPRPTYATSGPLAAIIAALAVVCAAGALLGCSSSSAKPPPLGACVPENGVPCTSLGASGESTAAPDSGRGGTGGGTGGDGGMCGGAETQLASTPVCSACILTGATSVGGFDCCKADEACSFTDCVEIVACARTCAVGDTACVGTCESFTTPAGVTAYRDFAQCLQTNCPTQCPTLTQ